jgi:membrane associated rhomboid family serine protease
VGYHCVDCVAAGRRTTRRPVTPAGARLSRQPVVVFLLIVVNALVYLATLVDAGSLNQSDASNLFAAWALSPVDAARGEWWRLLTSGFLHLSLFHLATNMIALWILGRDLEMLLGRSRFCVVYGLSLLGGSTSVFLFSSPVEPVAGASGAIFGLMGGIAVAAFKLRVSLRPVLMVIVLNVVLSVAIPNISLLGHLGGLVTGVVSTAAILYAPSGRRLLWQSAGAAAVLVVLLLLLTAKEAQFSALAF